MQARSLIRPLLVAVALARRRRRRWRRPPTRMRCDTTSKQRPRRKPSTAKPAAATKRARLRAQRQPQGDDDAARRHRARTPQTPPRKAGTATIRRRATPDDPELPAHDAASVGAPHRARPDAQLPAQARRRADRGAARDRSRRRRERLRHHPRPIGLRQEHAAAHRRRPRPADRAARCCSTAGASTAPGADRGMVFQSYTLFPWLTVLDNVCFGLRERGLARAEQLEIANGFIAKVGLRRLRAPLPEAALGRHAAAHGASPARSPTARASCSWTSPSARSTTRRAS